MKIDLGCGGRKREGFIGLDCTPAPGVDHILDLTKDPLPFPDRSVEHVYSAHFLEHIGDPAYLFHEIGRVCQEGAKIEFWAPYAHGNDAFLYGHVTFLTETVWSHFCVLYRDFHAPMLRGRWLLRNVHFVIPRRRKWRLRLHGYSIAFALRHLRGVADEFGVEIEYRSDLSTPTVRPRHTFGRSRDERRPVQL